MRDPTHRCSIRNLKSKAILQDVLSYREQQQTLALLEILALGQRQIDEGKVVRVRHAINRICQDSVDRE